MARFVVGAAALVSLGRAVSLDSKEPGQFGHDDSKDVVAYLNPNSVPRHDKCGVDCTRICREGLGRTEMRMMCSKSDCTDACFAHAIETPHKKEGIFDTNHQQGKYVQKVMSEYCSRGASGTYGLLQASAVEKHEETAGEVAFLEAEQEEAYSPNTWRGDPRAVTSGWPSGPASSTYYCQEICQNIYHKAVTNLGQHPGAGPNWAMDQSQCGRDCSNNWPSMRKYWDEWCTCFKSPGGNMHLETVPGLVQEKQEIEPVDVGSFMQVPAGEL